jgi:hypothetical protein
MAVYSESVLLALLRVCKKPAANYAVSDAGESDLCLAERGTVSLSGGCLTRFCE